MSELTEIELQQAIKTVSNRVEPVTLDEIKRRAASAEEAPSSWTSRKVLSSESITRHIPNRYLVAAAAVALILVGLIFLSEDSGRRLETVEDPAVTTSIPRQSTLETELDSEETQAIATIERFAEALEEVDPGAANALIDGGATIRLGIWGESLAEQLEFWQIAGARAVLQECEALPNPGLFECIFWVDDTVTRAQGLAPLEMPASIEVEDGAIRAATFDLALLQNWTLNGWAPYAEWAAENRPEDFALVYPNGFTRSGPPSDPLVKELNATLIEEFARTLARGQLTELEP